MNGAPEWLANLGTGIDLLAGAVEMMSEHDDIPLTDAGLKRITDLLTKLEAAKPYLALRDDADGWAQAFAYSVEYGVRQPMFKSVSVLRLQWEAALGLPSTNWTDPYSPQRTRHAEEAMPLVVAQQAESAASFAAWLRTQSVKFPG